MAQSQAKKNMSFAFKISVFCSA